MQSYWNWIIYTKVKIYVYVAGTLEEESISGRND